MKLRTFISSSRVLVLFWTCVFLGSCTVIQNYDSSEHNFFSIQSGSTDGLVKEEEHCGAFTRQIRVNHIRPVFPTVDVTKLTPEEVNDILLTYTEQLKKYVVNEEKYLNEDILRHRQNCHNDEVEFLKMEPTNLMEEEHHNTNKVR